VFAYGEINEEPDAEIVVSEGVAAQVHRFFTRSGGPNSSFLTTRPESRTFSTLTSSHRYG
jgi:hypothetical protein